MISTHPNKRIVALWGLAGATVAVDALVLAICVIW
jgi:hypothetical protein